MLSGPNGKLFFLFLNQNICHRDGSFEYPQHQDASFEYPQHMFWFRTYVVGAQKNCLIKTLLLSTHNICLVEYTQHMFSSHRDGSFEYPKHLFKLMDKKIIAILRKLFLLNWPYVDTLWKHLSEMQ